MINWKKNENTLEVKFEDVIANYDNMWKEIFLHLGFSNNNLKIALEIAKKHDLGRMSKKQIIFV